MTFEVRELIDTSFMDHSVMISRYKRGMVLSFLMSSANRVSERKVLPFMLDMVHVCVFSVLTSVARDRMIPMALLVGLFCLFHKRELFLTSGQDHYLHTARITFVFRAVNESLIYVQVFSARGMDPSTLQQVIILVPTMKNDQEGTDIQMGVSDGMSRGYATATLLAHREVHLAGIPEVLELFALCDQSSDQQILNYHTAYEKFHMLLQSILHE